MSWISDLDHYEQVAHQVDKSAQITTKDGWFWNALAWIVAVVTIGGMKPNVFLTRYATTIGPVQAYPGGWKNLKPETIVHESQHTRQARYFGLGIHPWVGLPLMALVYLLLPIPIGLAYFRYRLELNADKRRWRYMLSQGATPAEILTRARRFAATVSGGGYGWAWPRSWAEGGFRRAAKKAIEAHERR